MGIDGNEYFGPLTHGSKGKVAMKMLDNLVKYRSPNFPPIGPLSLLTSYQGRLAGKGEESGDHLNSGGNAEIDRLCESINKHKSDRDRYEALSAN